MSGAAGARGEPSPSASPDEERSAANALAGLAANYWAFQCDEFPISAIQAGVATDAELLLREAPADHQRRASWARNALSELTATDPGALGAQDRATWALLDHELNALIETVACGAHLRPALYPMGPEFWLIYWANTSALANPADARLYIARLAAIPAAFESVRAALAAGVEKDFRYPRLVIERAIGLLRGQVSMPVADNAFYQPLARVAGRSAAWAAFAEEGKAAVENQVYRAFLDYADFLETQLLPVARDGLACIDDVGGAELYRHFIKQYTTENHHPEDIHVLGRLEVERISGDMLAVAADAGFEGDIAGLRRRLQTDNSQFAESAEALREQIEILSKRIDARIPEFFGRTPRTTYGVKSIPESIAEKMPPAYAQPNPADASLAGVHWITSLPGKCPRYMHLPLALHEAWPGHLMHLALIQEMEHLPDFRRAAGMRYSACLEGWALYCERLGEEMGFYDTPEKRYGRLEMEMWRAVRLVIDTGIHAKGWGRGQAIAYFQEHMAMPLETIAAEVDRYIGFPGQALAYQLGNLKFRELRERAETMLGEAFRIRDFHDALMAAGPVTLPVLENLIDDWIAAVCATEAA
ncbi:DUF885 domain-containing protein [Sphingomonas sp.]|uniref:DUF885 domain-containing protein n=1 Tax=Sphingomonas sp. TaxID=28214 RepID=UPI003D6C9BE1